jgi:cob(I)alamin adenosyltransferase
MAVRVTKQYQEGLSFGDSGFSLLHNNEYVTKSSPACVIYGSIELLQHNIDTVLTDNHSFYVEDFKEVLEWLSDAFFSLSSFCFYKGHLDSRKNSYMFPYSFLSFITDKIDFYKDTAENKDFLRFRHKHLCAINLLRVGCRKVESDYVAWWESDLVDRERRMHPEIEQDIRYQNQVLNRLSSYFYWVGRHEASLLTQHSAGFIPCPEWSGTMPPFLLTETV